MSEKTGKQREIDEVILLGLHILIEEKLKRDNMAGATYLDIPLTREWIGESDRILWELENKRDGIGQEEAKG